MRTSRWCRARHTAELAFGAASVAAEPALDSFFDARADAPARTAALRALIFGWRGRPGVLALVTHQVNVTALTGFVPAEGEVVVLRPEGDEFAIVGRVAP